MASSFSFSFSGDDIDVEPADERQQPSSAVVAESVSSPSVSSAFPVQGKPQLPPTRHTLAGMLSRLPSKIAYSTLEVELDGGAGVVALPRRELWDVRVQLAAEDDEVGGGSGQDADDDSGLGKHDVRSGIYEGGFKSWESSVDLVKTLWRDDLCPAKTRSKRAVRMIELGCGTALPSLAVFQWALSASPSSPCVTGGEATTEPPSPSRQPLLLTLADYNPSVLFLVTLPNLILAWALFQHQHSGSQLLQDALSSSEGELELSDEVKAAFLASLRDSNISLAFFSGGWSPTFVDLLYDDPVAAPDEEKLPPKLDTLVVGAETIYSPFALAAFAETLLSILRRERGERPDCSQVSVVAAKRLYFGVGGSLDDFVDRITTSGAITQVLREETEGVRRGIVQCRLP